MIIVSGTAIFKDGALAAIGEAMAHMITASRAEDGCLHYAYGIDVLNQNEMVVLEYWRDWAALDAHFQTTHMADWRTALKDVVVSRDIKAVATDGQIKNL